MIGQPAQVNSVPIIDCCSQFDLDREHFAVVARHHQIDLMVAVTGPEVTDGSLGGLSNNPDDSVAKDSKDA